MHIYLRTVPRLSEVTISRHLLKTELLISQRIQGAAAAATFIREIYISSPWFVARG